MKNNNYTRLTFLGLAFGLVLSSVPAQGQGQIIMGGTRLPGQAKPKPTPKPTPKPPVLKPPMGGAAPRPTPKPVDRYTLEARGEVSYGFQAVELEARLILNGQPLYGKPIQFIIRDDTPTVGMGYTDANGVARVKLRPYMRESPLSPLRLPITLPVEVNWPERGIQGRTTITVVSGGKPG